MNTCGCILLHVTLDVLIRFLAVVIEGFFFFLDSDGIGLFFIDRSFLKIPGISIGGGLHGKAIAGEDSEVPKFSKRLGGQQLDCCWTIFP